MLGLADRSPFPPHQFLFKGAGANILRGVAGAGVLSMCVPLCTLFVKFLTDPPTVPYCRYDKLQELLFGKVYKGGSG